jgi:hypothetical protein
MLFLILILLYNMKINKTVDDIRLGYYTKINENPFVISNDWNLENNFFDSNFINSSSCSFQNLETFKNIKLSNFFLIGFKKNFIQIFFFFSFQSFFIKV